MKSRSLLLLVLFSALYLTSCGHPTSPVFNGTPNPYKVDVEALTKKSGKLRTGADQTEKYLPLLKGKKVGMVINPTSIIGGAFSVDTLKSLGVNIVKLFGPEHGFRGDASAGVKVDDNVDAKTGIPIISLYGKHHTPTAEDLKGIDVMIFDIQDVGVRFYTYINTLQHVMEACAENGKEVMIFDRPK